jgi:hypothetical protein
LSHQHDEAAPICGRRFVVLNKEITFVLVASLR